MNDKKKLKEGLAAIHKKANANFNHITVGEILAGFPGMELSEDQIRLIYKYLDEEHIIVEDYQPHDTRTVTPDKPALTGEEKAYFQMYLQDLEDVRPCTESEEKILVSQLLGGDESVQNRLIEGNLHRVLKLAGARVGRGVLIGDLVQEGNMALVLAIEEYCAAGVRIQGEPLARFLESRIDQAMKALVQEQGSFDRAGEQMAREANRLLEVTETLEEELGREVTLAELAEGMKLSEDEVENILRVSYSAMEIGEGDSDSGEEHGHHEHHEHHDHDCGCGHHH